MSKSMRFTISRAQPRPFITSMILFRRPRPACSARSRFSTEEDLDLDRIPTEFIDRRWGGIRCDGDRCSALAGEVGISTCAGFMRCALRSAARASPATMPASSRGTASDCHWSCERWALSFNLTCLSCQTTSSAWHHCNPPALLAALDESGSVKGFGCRPFTDGATGTGAGETFRS